MDNQVSFFFDNSVFETMPKSYLFTTNTTICASCNERVENISTVTLFHNHCCYNREDKEYTKLVENEILLITYYLNYYNKTKLIEHLDNIKSLKHNFPQYIQVTPPPIQPLCKQA